MCIIAYKPKGQPMPSEEIIRNCFNSNHDGAGIMYAKDNRVYIHKGLMTLNKVYEKLSSLEDMTDLPVVLHFRIGTAGPKSPELTHPFPISNKIEHLMAKNVICNWGVAHNGCISSVNFDHRIMSDTQAFIQQFISQTNPTDLKTQVRIRNLSGWSRFVFMNKSGEVIILKDTDGIWDNGIWYSNSGYRSYNYWHKSII